LLVGAIGNASPALAEVHPQAADKALIEDDLVGSGFELCEQRPARHALKRLEGSRPRTSFGDAAKAIKAAREELCQCKPGLGAALVAAVPRTRRDVGTMIRCGDSIRFNRTYVLSLSRDQLFDHCGSSPFRFRARTEWLNPVRGADPGQRVIELGQHAAAGGTARIR
jgi:hypothetical protein